MKAKKTKRNSKRSRQSSSIRFGKTLTFRLVLEGK